MTIFHFVLVVTQINRVPARYLCELGVRFSCQNLSHIKTDMATGVTGYVPYRYPTPLLDPVNH